MSITSGSITPKPSTIPEDQREDFIDFIMSFAIKNESNTPDRKDMLSNCGTRKEWEVYLRNGSLNWNAYMDSDPRTYEKRAPKRLNTLYDAWLDDTFISPLKAAILEISI